MEDILRIEDKSIFLQKKFHDKSANIQSSNKFPTPQNI